MTNARNNTRRALLDAAYEIEIEEVEVSPAYGNSREQRADRLMFGRLPARVKSYREDEGKRARH